MLAATSERNSSDQQYIDLYNFIAEKSENAKIPLSITNLSREFKETTGATQEISVLKRRIERFRSLIHTMDNFGIDTKVKMMFAISAPVNIELLSKLNEIADFELDNCKRIVSFKKKDGGLELHGLHFPWRPEQSEKEKKMLRFLAERSQEAVSPMSDHRFLSDYKTMCASPEHIDTLKKQYRRLKKFIYISDEYDDETKVRMMFTSNTKLQDWILTELRETASVEVDNENRIVVYSAFNGNLELRGQHSPIGRFNDREETLWDWIDKSLEDGRRQPGTLPDLEMLSFVRFLIEQCQNIEFPFIVKNLHKRYVENAGSTVSLSITQRRVKKCQQNIHKLKNLDYETKVKMFFGLGSFVNNEFLMEMCGQADVRLDEQRRIINYKTRGEEGFELSGNHHCIKQQITLKNMELLMYLAERASNTDQPIPDTRFLKDYQEAKGNNARIDNLRGRYQTAKEVIYEINVLDKATKIRMLFVSNARIEDYVLDDLRNNAIVEVDLESKMTKYIAHDGSLKLEGQHNIPKKRKFDETYFYVDEQSTTSDAWNSKRMAEDDDDDPISDQLYLDFSNLPSQQDSLTNSMRSEQAENSDQSRVPEEQRSVRTEEIPELLSEFFKSYKESFGMIDFLIEKTKDVTGPMDLTKLSKEFKEHTQSTRTISHLRERIQNCDLLIQALRSVDIDSKVRILIAVGAPVSLDFLTELNQSAEVKLDDSCRIIEYQKKGEELKLTASYTPFIPSIFNIDEEMLRFLAQSAKCLDTPLPDIWFLADFKETVGIKECENTLRKRYSRLKEQIFKCEGFEMDLKVKMLFVSNAKLSDHVLEELRKDAIVAVDMHKRITKYTANDGSLDFEGEHYRDQKSAYESYLRSNSDLPSTSDDYEIEEDDVDSEVMKAFENESGPLISNINIRFFDFFAEKAKNIVKPLQINQLCRDFIQENELSLSERCLYRRFHRGCAKISKMDRYDTDTKVRMLFAASAPVDKDFLDQLANEAEIKVDELQRIIEYKKKDGELELSIPQARVIAGGSTRAVEKDKHLLHFLAAKSITTDLPIADTKFLKEYIDSGVSLNYNTLKRRYTHVKTEIYTAEEFDKATRIRMLFVSRATVQDWVLNELRKDALVKVGHKNRIIAYVAKNYSLILLDSVRKEPKIEQQKHYCSSREDATEYTTIDERIQSFGDYSPAMKTKIKRSYIEKDAVLKKNLIPFLTEKCKNTTSPIPVAQLMKEFKEKFEFSENYDYFRSGVAEYRDENHKIEGLDKNTVVRQKFALSACLDQQYINELQKEAHLKLDSRMRITEYRANDGSLNLQGGHHHATILSKNRTRGEMMPRVDSEESSIEKDDNLEERTVAMLRSKRLDRKDAPPANPPSKYPSSSNSLESNKVENLETELATLRKKLENFFPGNKQYEIYKQHLFKGFISESSSVKYDASRTTKRTNSADSSKIAKKKPKRRSTGCSVRVTRSGKPYSVKKASALNTVDDVVSKKNPNKKEPEDVRNESSIESDSEEPIPDDTEESNVRMTRSGHRYTTTTPEKKTITTKKEYVPNAAFLERIKNMEFDDDPCPALASIYHMKLGDKGLHHLIQELLKSLERQQDSQESEASTSEEQQQESVDIEMSGEVPMKDVETNKTTSEAASIPQQVEQEETYFGIKPPVPLSNYAHLYQYNSKSPSNRIATSSFYPLPPARNICGEGTSSSNNSDINNYEPLDLTRMASLRSKSLRAVGISSESAAFVLAGIANTVVKEEVDNDDDIHFIEQPPVPPPSVLEVVEPQVVPVQKNPEPAFKVPVLPKIKLNEIISQKTHKKLLGAIQDMMKSLDMTISEDVQERVKKMFAKLDEADGNKKNKVTMREIRNSIEQCVFIVSKSSTEPTNEESVSLRNFFLLFRNIIISINLPIFNNLEQKLKRRITEVSAQELKVPVKKIQSALGTIIEIVAP